ncbi:hypothetical protein DdX_21946 [Ditylenchus destructor]|uniref:Uncharacterized protein n=1 Tax=Ditylenchus destructor TaxID=166010 RepID=A0AAD4QV82_9BILA|nr:hypothetical protein DdX_21946 [Ditylenchus destructor]
MPQYRGEDPLAVEPVERIGVGVADPRRLDLDHHLAGLGPFEVDLDDLQWLLGFERDGGAGLHGVRPPCCPALFGKGRAGAPALDVLDDVHVGLVVMPGQDRRGAAMRRQGSAISRVSFSEGRSAWPMILPTSICTARSPAGQMSGRPSANSR